MGKLKIAMTSPWKVRCGIAKYTEHLAKAIARRGHEVYIVRVHRWGRPFPLEYWETLALRRIPEDVDIIHCQHEYGILHYCEHYLYKHLKFHGLPIVSTMHCTGINWQADEIVAKNSDVVIVHNKHCQSLLRHPSVIIPHGCSLCDPLPEDKAIKTLQERWNINWSGPFVSIFGFVTPYRRYEDVIRAVGRLPDVHLLVAGGWHVEGEMPYIRQLQQLAAQEAPYRVHFLGYIPDELLPAVFGASRVVVTPHVFSSESGALLTTIGYGKAILASRAGGFPEKERKGALLCYKDAEDLQLKLAMLLRDDDARRRLEEGAKRYAERNSWEKVACKHVKLYRSVV